MIKIKGSRGSRRIEYMIECIQCHKEFNTTNDKHIFCSHLCDINHKNDAISKRRAIEQKPVKRDLFGFAA